MIFSRSNAHYSAGLAAEGRAITRWQYDEPSGQIVVCRVQDVEPILEINKRLQTSGDGYTESRNMRHVAEIPKAVIDLWYVRDGVDIYNPDHMPEIKRRLNDSENLFLRTCPGRV